ncbi:AIPR protein [Rugamonas sp. FT107W]|uniref:AIPR protein n=1 Tax=Duganella vulcania TaxID=2692166 RepID=A0A845HMC6_9BURK|nr:AIPR family protein [Duganella vulcania]MYN19667.1 AIPR protein [Duganella vulcania]
MKTKYEILISILDKLNKEAPLSNATYHKKDFEGKNHARSLSLIHLFLKSKFGLMDFSERFKYITDGGGDGGVDAYYIDSQNKSIYIIQSKFRANKDNFEEKIIKYEELSSIEIERIRKGETVDESGAKYNGKILGFQKRLDEIEDIVRYDYKVVLLANIGTYKKETIKRLLGGFDFDVYNFSRIYNEIVFPVCSGMYFDPRNITFEIETTEKGTEFSHSIETSYGEFSVRLIFVPALELARNVLKYRNSLLKFNPRNYLSLSNNGVNESIRESIVDEEQNIFALLNNGITFVATSDSFTDRTGRKGKGKLTIVKPQIINGGQTAYTLGKLLEEGREKELQGKSVLVKIITSADESKDIDTELIEQISLANNRQSKIVEADQRSNSPFLIELQKYLFENHNLFFERKRGEFFEGIEDKYLPKDSIVNRVDFIKSVIAFRGEVAKTRTSQEVIFEEEYFLKLIEKPNKKLMSLAYLARRELKKVSSVLSPFPALGAFGQAIDETKVTDKNVAILASQVEKLAAAWPKFEAWAIEQKHNSTYVHSELLNENYYKGKTVDDDLKNYFSKKRITLNY